MASSRSQAHESNGNRGIITVGNNSVHEHPPCDTNKDDIDFEDGEVEGYVAEEATPNEYIGDSDCTDCLPENLLPPSECYSNKTTNGAPGAMALDDDTGLNIPVENDDSYELEGEWIPDDPHEVVDWNGFASDEGTETRWKP